MLPPLLAATSAGPLTADALPALRAVTPPFLPRPALTPAWRWRTVAGLPGSPDVRVLLIEPALTRAVLRPAILHLHGGGFVGGSAEASLWRSQALARDVGAVIVSVEYRLAPETPFPGALDDNYAAFTWMYVAAEELGIDRARIALVGDSAGGGHAAMLALAARDRGEFAIAGQALVYPMLDDRTGSVSRKPPHQGAVLWTEERNRFGWGALLAVAAGSDAVPVGAVPARAADLRGLPPTWIGVGSIDLFADEDIDFARRLAAAGVPVRLNVVPGAFHLFDAFDVPLAHAFHADLIAWLRGVLADGSGVAGAHDPVGRRAKHSSPKAMTGNRGNSISPRS